MMMLDPTEAAEKQKEHQSDKDKKKEEKDKEKEDKKKDREKEKEDCKDGKCSTHIALLTHRVYSLIHLCIH
jgi:hypothetical protein